MENLMFIILIGLAFLVVLNLIVSLFRKFPNVAVQVGHVRQDFSIAQNRLEVIVRDELSNNRKEFMLGARTTREEVGQALEHFGSQQQGIFKLVNSQVRDMVQSNEQRFGKFQETTTASLDKILKEVDNRLVSIQKDNNLQLEKMRETVDEKLHQTLEDRLGRSFKLVSDHLERVQKGLGEMQNLAAGVGDLKRVLANVKTRGILGEVQLMNIIEEIMIPEQYELNVQIMPQSLNRVEIAIKLPGRSESEKPVWLPIDAKFPMDKYQSLQEAYDVGHPEILAVKIKEFGRAILAGAKNIQEKYISPPYTTDFAIMFVPVEGLYAEISRQPGLLHQLKSEFQIMVAGPNNLSAFLSSLQLGFRTLAIEKRSSEVWKLLDEIKSEFGKFGMVLEKVQKKLTEANKAIDDAGVRKRVIERKLNKAQELPAGDQQITLGTSSN